MENLSKMSRHDLEKIFSRMVSDLEIQNPSLLARYLEEMEDCIYHISPDEAKTIVSKMKPAGEKFSWDYVKTCLSEKNTDIEEEDIVDYYLVMNMFANDYKMVFDKFPAFNQKDVFYYFAKGFIEDEDGPKHKVGKYFTMK